MATAAMCYRRLAIQQSIPLVSLLSQFRRLDTLVLRAYSPSVNIGKNVINWGGLYDPDLTEIGDDVVLGGQSTVAAHSMVMRDDGAMIYVSAPGEHRRSGDDRRRGAHRTRVRDRPRRDRRGRRSRRAVHADPSRRGVGRQPGAVPQTA